MKKLGLISASLLTFVKSKAQAKQIFIEQELYYADELEQTTQVVSNGFNLELIIFLAMVILSIIIGLASYIISNYKTQSVALEISHLSKFSREEMI